MFRRNKPPNDEQYSLRTIVAQSIALTVLLCVGGSILLAILGKATPELVKHLGTTTSGALIAMLITPDDKR